MTNCYSVFRIDLLKMVNLRLPFLKFLTQLLHFNSSASVVSENNDGLPESIVLMYSKIVLNSKFKFSRK